ncbi:MAG: DUF2167 domain-containing protein [Gammaproteobacteria bacterium]|nr:DUF2167 domain-containing protein [Gammaproteobacteria bacterium]
MSQPPVIRPSLAALLALLLCISGASRAADSPKAPDAPGTPSAAQAALAAARDAARAAIERGPVNIRLRDQAQLELPPGFGFIPQKESAALLSAMGNDAGPDLLGLIVPLGEARWFVVANYDPSGYVKDDDARHWDAEKLLQNLKDGTEAGNAARAKVGVPPLEVTRWIEPPAYTADSHRLIWSAEAQRKDGVAEDPTVNYNTYVLGREGFISMNLITSASAIDADKAAAHALLSAVSFNDGKRYADFNSSSDKVAAYGLAALVAGVAAKKIGLLALFAATIVKFAKVIAVAAAAAIAIVTRWLKGRGARAG